VQHAALGVGEIQTFAGAGNGHVHQPPLLFQTILFEHALFVRTQAFFHAADEYAVKFQALGRMHRHQLHGLLAFARLAFTRFQRGVGEEGGERVRHFFGALAVVFFQERARGIHQLFQVFHPVGFGLGGLIVRNQAAGIEQVLDLLGQIQAHGIAPQRFDE